MSRLDLETQLVAYSLQDARGYAEALTLGVTPTHFSDDALRALWSLIGASVPVEDMLVQLKGIEGAFERFNRVTSFEFATTQNPAAYVRAAAKELLETVERGWTLNQLRDIETAIAKGHPLSDVGKIANDIAARLLDKQTKRPKTRYEVGQKYLAEKAANKLRPVPLAFGIEVVDRLLSNVLPGEFILIAARAGEGKTVWATQMAQKSALIGAKVQIITGEMRDVELYCRMVSQQIGIDGKTLRQGTLPSHVTEALERENQRWEGVPLTIEQMGSSRTGDDLINSIKRAFLSGIQVVVIDYVGLVGGGRFRSRHEEMADMSRKLKLVASETGGVVVALAQLNRAAVTDRKQGDLNLSHLAESDGFARDSELVFMLSQKDDGSGHTTVVIAKNRHGERGKFFLQFDGKTTQFTEEIYEEPKQQADEIIYF